MTTLANLGENKILERLLPGLPSNDSLLVGPGDDCAVLQRDAEWDSLFKTDVIVEGIHFTRGTEPELIGRKALARAMSDIAAMGGAPEHALISLLVHSSREMSEIEGIYRGISRLATDWGVSIAGGETSSLPYDGLIINVSMLGKVPKGKAVLRSTAQVGDLIAVTGELGDSFDSGHHLHFVPRIKEGAILREMEIATAMIDVSDGLLIDLQRLCDASGVTFNLNNDFLPCRNGCSFESALNQGEDYELLLSLKPDSLERLKHLNYPEHQPITIIGEIVELSLDKKDGFSFGWQHFIDAPSNGSQ